VKFLYYHRRGVLYRLFKTRIRGSPRSDECAGLLFPPGSPGTKGALPFPGSGWFCAGKAYLRVEQTIFPLSSEVLLRAGTPSAGARTIGGRPLPSPTEPGLWGIWGVAVFQVQRSDTTTSSLLENSLLTGIHTLVLLRRALLPRPRARAYHRFRTVPFQKQEARLSAVPSESILTRRTLPVRFFVEATVAPLFEKDFIRKEVPSSFTKIHFRSTFSPLGIFPQYEGPTLNG